MENNVWEIVCNDAVKATKDILTSFYDAYVNRQHHKTLLQEFPEIFDQAEIDNLGKDIIFYFPDVEWET